MLVTMYVVSILFQSTETVGLEGAGDGSLVRARSEQDSVTLGS